MKPRSRHGSTHSSMQPQGLLLIPDISGFTEFVSEVEISHSEHIIAELLELLINANRLKLELCEIEGDALFFYRHGPAPSLDEMVGQAKSWVEGFHSHLKLLKRDVYCNCGACQSVGRLSLKVVGHFGEFAEYKVKKKLKVIGKDVILVHRLLKNNVAENEYLLLTDPLLELMGVKAGNDSGFETHSETYSVIGDVSGGVMNLTEFSANIPDPVPMHLKTRLDGEITYEGELDVPFETVVATIGDLKTWPDWVAGLDRMKIDWSEPIKPGHHHVCVFPGQDLSITMEQIEEKKDDFTMVENLKPPFMLKKMFFIHHVKRQGDGCSYRATVTFARKPLIGRMFDKMGVPVFQGQLEASFENLKSLLEK